jgi:hypothetical protein
MRFCPVGAELFHADGQTDMTKLVVAFRKFANTPKIQFTFSPTCFHHRQTDINTQTVEHITEVHTQMTALSAF